MIKQIWEVKNKRKMFSGLNFAIALVTLIYTVAKFSFIPDLIYFYFSSYANVNKICIFIIPLSQITICIMLYVASKRCIRLNQQTTINTTPKQARQSATRDILIGNNFILMVTFFLVQMNVISSAMINKTPSIVAIIIGLVALVVFNAYSMFKYIKSK